MTRPWLILMTIALAACRSPTPSTEPLDSAPLAGCIQGSFTPYFGNLHGHTGYSDGELTPADAFEHARQAGLDILVVTDHLEQMTFTPRWPSCLDQAEEKNADGQFVAGCGFEYASFRSYVFTTGHLNVYFAEALFDPLELDFRRFYQRLSGCERCVGQLNHPGAEPGMTWNGFEWSAAAEEQMALFELNGSGPTWDLYFQALDAGWRVGPQRNQDNHRADWGTANGHRSGFFLSELSREALREAMLARRVFATEDPNASIRLLAQGSCWMGSRLSGVDLLTLSAEAVDLDADESFERIELFGPAGTLLAEVACPAAPQCTAEYRLDVESATYVVVRALQRDGDVLVSAPLWARP